MKSSYRNVFDKNIDISFTTGLSLLKDFPGSRKSFLSIAGYQSKAQKKRGILEKEDVLVPPLLIISTTDKCNLNCKGCYAVEGCSTPKKEMSRQQMDRLLSQAVEAGCSAVLLAGGEPLLCKEWLEALAKQPDLLGLVFTNGTLVDQTWIDWFSENRSIIPLFSIEGNADKTDSRRGLGVAEKINQAMQLCNDARIPFGVSITTGGHNMEEVTEPNFIESYIGLGCRLVIHVEYVPVGEADELFALTEESKLQLDKYCRISTKEKKAYFIAFPGDETQYGGCLAAGRGFVHINASGSLEPCPFASYSDRNVCESSLVESLKSPLFRAIRAESNRLHEGVGGCALRSQGEWMAEQIANQSAVEM